MHKPSPLEEIPTIPCTVRGRLAAGMLGAVLGAAALAPFRFADRGPERVASVRSAGAELSVRAAVATQPGITESGSVEGASDIEFYPSYLVVKRPDGSGRVYFGERTVNFSWSVRPGSSPDPTR